MSPFKSEPLARIVERYRSWPPCVEKFTMLLWACLSGADGMGEEETPSALAQKLAECVSCEKWHQHDESYTKPLEHLVRTESFEEARKQCELFLRRRVVPFDVFEAQHLVHQSQTFIEKLQGAQNAVIFLGNSGSGKTTSILYWGGYPMYQNEHKHVVPDPEAAPEGFVVNSNPESETAFVRAIRITDMDLLTELDHDAQDFQRKKPLLLVDTPGFQDSRSPETDVANSVSILRALRACKSFHPVITVSATGGNNYEQNQEAMRTAANFFTRAETLASCSSFAFTRYASERDADAIAATCEHLCNQPNMVHAEHLPLLRAALRAITSDNHEEDDDEERGGGTKGAAIVLPLVPERRIHHLKAVLNKSALKPYHVAQHPAFVESTRISFNDQLRLLNTSVQEAVEKCQLDLALLRLKQLHALIQIVGDTQGEAVHRQRSVHTTLQKQLQDRARLADLQAAVRDSHAGVVPHSVLRAVRTALSITQYLQSGGSDDDGGGAIVDLGDVEDTIAQAVREATLALALNIKRRIDTILQTTLGFPTATLAPAPVSAAVEKKAQATDQDDESEKAEDGEGREDGLGDTKGETVDRAQHTQEGRTAEPKKDSEPTLQNGSNSRSGWGTYAAWLRDVELDARGLLNQLDSLRELCLHCDTVTIDDHYHNATQALANALQQQRTAALEVVQPLHHKQGARIQLYEEMSVVDTGEDVQEAAKVDEGQAGRTEGDTAQEKQEQGKKSKKRQSENHRQQQQGKKSDRLALCEAQADMLRVAAQVAAASTRLARFFADHLQLDTNSSLRGASLRDVRQEHGLEPADDDVDATTTATGSMSPVFASPQRDPQLPTTAEDSCAGKDDNGDRSESGRRKAGDSGGSKGVTEEDAASTKATAVATETTTMTPHGSAYASCSATAAASPLTPSTYDFGDSGTSTRRTSARGSADVVGSWVADFEDALASVVASHMIALERALHAESQHERQQQQAKQAVAALGDSSVEPKGNTPVPMRDLILNRLLASLATEPLTEGSRGDRGLRERGLQSLCSAVEELLAASTSTSFAKEATVQAQAATADSTDPGNNVAGTETSCCSNSGDSGGDSDGTEGDVSHVDATAQSTTSVDVSDEVYRLFETTFALLCTVEREPLLHTTFLRAFSASSDTNDSDTTLAALCDGHLERVSHAVVAHCTQHQHVRKLPAIGAHVRHARALATLLHCRHSASWLRADLHLSRMRQAVSGMLATTKDHIIDALTTAMTGHGSKNNSSSNNSNSASDANASMEEVQKLMRFLRSERLHAFEESVQQCLEDVGAWLQEAIGTLINDIRYNGLDLHRVQRVAHSLHFISSCLVLPLPENQQQEVQQMHQAAQIAVAETLNVHRRDVHRALQQLGIGQVSTRGVSEGGSDPSASPTVPSTPPSAFPSPAVNESELDTSAVPSNRADPSDSGVMTSVPDTPAQPAARVRACHATKSTNLTNCIPSVVLARRLDAAVALLLSCKQSRLTNYVPDLCAMAENIEAAMHGLGRTLATGLARLTSQIEEAPSHRALEDCSISNPVNPDRVASEDGGQAVGDADTLRSGTGVLKREKKELAKVVHEVQEVLQAAMALRKAHPRLAALLDSEPLDESLPSAAQAVRRDVAYTATRSATASGGEGRIAAVVRQLRAGVQNREDACMRLVKAGDPHQLHCHVSMLDVLRDLDFVLFTSDSGDNSKEQTTGQQDAATHRRGYRALHDALRARPWNMLLEKEEELKQKLAERNFQQVRLLWYHISTHPSYYGTPRMRDTAWHMRSHVEHACKQARDCSLKLAHGYEPAEGFDALVHTVTDEVEQLTRMQAVLRWTTSSGGGGDSGDGGESDGTSTQSQPIWHLPGQCEHEHDGADIDKTLQAVRSNVDAALGKQCDHMDTLLTKYDFPVAAKAHANIRRWLSQLTAALRYADHPLWSRVPTNRVEDAKAAALQRLEDLQATAAASNTTDVLDVLHADLRYRPLSFLYSASSTVEALVALHRDSVKERPLEDIFERDLRTLRSVCSRLPDEERGAMDEYVEDAVQHVRQKAKAAAREVEALLDMNKFAEAERQAVAVQTAPSEANAIVVDHLQGYAQRLSERALSTYSDLGAEPQLHCIVRKLGLLGRKLNVAGAAETLRDIAERCKSECTSTIEQFAFHLHVPAGDDDGASTSVHNTGEHQNRHHLHSSSAAHRLLVHAVAMEVLCACAQSEYLACASSGQAMRGDHEDVRCDKVARRLRELHKVTVVAVATVLRSSSADLQAALDMSDLKTLQGEHSDQAEQLQLLTRRVSLLSKAHAALSEHEEELRRWARNAEVETLAFIFGTSSSQSWDGSQEIMAVQGALQGLWDSIQRSARQVLGTSLVPIDDDMISAAEDAAHVDDDDDDDATDGDDAAADGRGDGGGLGGCDDAAPLIEESVLLDIVRSNCLQVRCVRAAAEHALCLRRAAADMCNIVRDSGFSDDTTIAELEAIPGALTSRVEGELRRLNEAMAQVSAPSCGAKSTQLSTRLQACMRIVSEEIGPFIEGVLEDDVVQNLQERSETLLHELHSSDSAMRVKRALLLLRDLRNSMQGVRANISKGVDEFITTNIHRDHLAEVISEFASDLQELY